MNKDSLDGCTCGISDRENREHQPGCRFFNQELWDIVLNHRVQLLNADRNADLAKEADAECVAAINKTIMEDVTELIDQPIDIFITNDLPSLLDGGETAAMHYDHFRKKLRQAIIKKYGAKP